MDEASVIYDIQFDNADSPNSSATDVGKKESSRVSFTKRLPGLRNNTESKSDSNISEHESKKKKRGHGRNFSLITNIGLGDRKLSKTEEEHSSADSTRTTDDNKVDYRPPTLVKSALSNPSFSVDDFNANAQQKSVEDSTPKSMSHGSLNAFDNSKHTKEKVNSREKKRVPADRCTSMFPGEHVLSNELLNALELPEEIKTRINNIVSPGNPDDRFCVLEQIGTGAQATVYLARDRKTAELFAVKKAKIDKDNAKTILDEAELLTKLVHKNCIRAEACYYVHREFWIFMEYASAGDLVTMIERESLSEEILAVIVYQVLKGLAYIHSVELVHRDIKASNLLLNSSGEVKIADFGIASSGGEDEEIDVEQTIAGSSYWMAPEIIYHIDSMKNFKPSCDIWSLGITIIELVDKIPPLFDLKPVSALYRIVEGEYNPTFAQPENWSETLKDFLEKCLQKKPENRPSAQELLEHEFLKGKSKSKALIEYTNKNAPVIIDKREIEVERNRRKPRADPLIKKKNIMRINLPLGRKIFVSIDKEVSVVKALTEALKELNLKSDQCDLYLSTGKKGRLVEPSEIAAKCAREVGASSQNLLENKKKTKMTMRKRVEMVAAVQFYVKPNRPSSAATQEFWNLIPNGSMEQLTEEYSIKLMNFLAGNVAIAHNILRLVDIPPNDKKIIFGCITEMYHLKENSLPSLINASAKFEVGTLKDGNAFLKGNSLSGNLVGELLKYKCPDWIKTILAPCLPQIVTIKHNIELDKQKSGNKNLKQSVKQIGNLVSTVISSFIMNLERVPSEIQDIVVTCEQLARRAGAENFKIVKFILFEKCLIPALLNPAKYGILFDIPLYGQQALVLVTSVINGIINNKVFSHQYMDKLNSYVESLSQQVDEGLLTTYKMFENHSCQKTLVRSKAINQLESCQKFIKFVCKHRSSIESQLGSGAPGDKGKL